MPSLADTIPSRLPFALALAALAGAVDAIGLLRVGDLFVSFMSGNTTELGIAAAGGRAGAAWRVGAVVLMFVAGVVGGEVAASLLPPRRRAAALLGIVAVILSAAALQSALRWPALAVSLSLAVSMGVQNAVVRRAAGVDVAITYVTGTLVHLGRAVAAALLGRGGWPRALPFAALWLAFAAGAAAGGVAASAGTAQAIGAAAAVAALLLLASLRPPPSSSTPSPGLP